MSLGFTHGKKIIKTMKIKHIKLFFTGKNMPKKKKKKKKSLLRLLWETYLSDTIGAVMK